MERRERNNFDQALKEGQRRIDSGDIDGYWRLMARHDPYAELAGDVAAGRGALAAIATGRLQQAARETRGHEFSPKEIRALQHEIAKADLKKRQKNVADKSDIRVTSQDTVKYHRDVLVGKSLPEGTYTPRHLQKVMGGFWSTYAGTPTKDVSGPNFWKAYAEHKAKDIKGFVSNPVGYVHDLAKFGKTLGQAVGHVSDHLDRKFFEWLEGIDKARAVEVLSRTNPPRKPIPPPSAPAQTISPGARPALGGSAPEPAPPPARPRNKPVTGLDRLQDLFGRPFQHLVKTASGRVPVDDPAILHVDEIDALMTSSAYRQSVHPQYEKTQNSVKKWFEATYPGPVQYDATGRMIRQPRRDRPASAPSWIQGMDSMSLRGRKRIS